MPAGSPITCQPDAAPCHRTIPYLRTSRAVLKALSDSAGTAIAPPPPVAPPSTPWAALLDPLYACILTLIVSKGYATPTPIAPAGGLWCGGDGGGGGGEGGGPVVVAALEEMMVRVTRIWARERLVVASSARDGVATRTEHSRSQADRGRNIPDGAASDHRPPVRHALHRPPGAGGTRVAAAAMPMALMVVVG